MKNFQGLIIIALIAFQGQGTHSKLKFLVKLIHFIKGQMYLYDLTQGSVSANSAQWTCSTGGFPTTSCFGYTLLGGYGNFGTGSYAYRTFTGLSTHSSLTISFWAFYIDSWDGTSPCCSVGPLYDSYLLYVDGTLVFDNIYLQTTLGGTSNVCGWYPTDYHAYTTVYNIAHSSSSVVLKFATGLDTPATDESFGVSDITITVCDPTCNTCNTVDTQCTSCTGTRYLYGTTCVTTCPTGYYPDSSTHTCDSNYFVLTRPLINY